jgi:squalene-hopene/tetraprenyl-beta-curcumene cyclase
LEGTDLQSFVAIMSSIALKQYAPKESARTLDGAVERARAALLDCQRADGHWVFELEADVTIPAEYVLLKHFLGERDASAEEKIAVYIRRRQAEHGGWPLYPGGPFNLSATVKGYFALKAIGDSPDAAHMQRARAAVLRHGGAEASNVFTRVLLALYGFIPWRAIPAIPVEIMLLPRWFPFHLSKISYWGRTVLVPLLVLQVLKPLARDPTGTRIDELFTHYPPRPRRRVRASHQSRVWFKLFGAIDATLHALDGLAPAALRRRATDKAVRFVTERLNGEDGLGAIFPAMANALIMLDALGYPRDHPHVAAARRAIEKLRVTLPREAYCQPCVSPIWDTALACHALLEAGGDVSRDAALQGLEWLRVRQVTAVAGDWSGNRPTVAPGGWAFQYANPHYPDLDDTAVVVMAMDKIRRDGSAPFVTAFASEIERARNWVIGLQSRNGGWGAFDADNTCEYLNHIPFADHGALLDPPAADVTARCIGMLAQLARPEDRAVIAAGIDFLRASQREDGSWYGRWGANYIYGTWSVLCALQVAGFGPRDAEVRRAADWLVTIQNEDGGWGESLRSYELDYPGHTPAPSTPSQTAWALLGLMAAGETDHPAVTSGIAWLVRSQEDSGVWREGEFTATGFPRVFYLRYHGYSKFFPLWALARYRELRAGRCPAVRMGL